MTLYLQGLAIPLDKKNINGWGIPSTDLDNVLASLPASTLKICPGEKHACDFTEDPNGIIGIYAAHWLEADGLHTKYEVTDSIAQRKLQDGSWKNFKWSMYGKSKTNPLFNDGWAGGTSVKNMTLVSNPAWPQAQFQIAAAEEDGPTELRLFSDFQLIASIDKEGDPITEELEKQIKELTASKVELEKKVTTLTASVDEKTKSLNIAVNDISTSKTALEAANETVTKLTASIDELKKDVDTKTTLIASLEEEKKGTVSLDKVETMIAAAIETHDSKKSADNDRQEAFKLYASVLDPEGKIEEYPNMTADNFRKLAEKAGATLSASANIRYPANPSGNSGFTVGRPKADGSWEA